MSINFKKFERWALKKFGEDNVLIRGNEIRLNSIFEEGDDDFHLWCNPSGGKNKHKFGVFHCFKTDKKGSLLKLVQLVDNCSRDDAKEILDGREPISVLEKKLMQILGSEETPSEAPVQKKSDLQLPDCCALIHELPANDFFKIRATDYLSKRKLPTEGLYVCYNGRYKNRIVIPYFDKNQKLIYWNARDLGNSKLKYLGPPKEVGVGKEDVIFMAGCWPKQGETIYLCEGEFNAITLKQAEFKAAACGGKNMSDKQSLMLSGYNVVLCLDRDKAGKSGTIKMSSMISALSIQNGKNDRLKYVFPPQGINDWNEFLIKKNTEILHHYILRSQRAIDYSSPYGTVGDYFNFQDL